jgi:3'-phosphoadenosine 5'-phosphosulfate sulfotransferase
MRISKYINVDRNVLVEYVYDDANLIGEAYEVGVNIKNSNYNFMSNSTSLTINTSANTLFPIDLISNVYGKFNTTTYPFLQVKN